MNTHRRPLFLPLALPRLASAAALVGAAVALPSVLLPSRAEACGGFFCSQTPIDQSAERIIFAMEDNRITAYIQVVYSGAAEDFAWVVPVSAVPDLDVAESTLFQALDQATAPVIIPPSCLQNVFFGDAESDGVPGASGGGSRGDEVIVYSEATVGPYDTAVVGSENASALIEWLNDNDYIITEPMVPIVEEYVADDMLFMAMKLSADQGVDALKPIVMSYEGSNPVIPIRLTAVAADPDMGIYVWLLGGGRASSANFSNVEIDPSDIRFDGSLRSNYRTLVSETVDPPEGRAFVTEYANRTSELIPSVFDPEAIALLEEYEWVTRVYTTISPEEMTADPVFTFNPSLPVKSNVIDLSASTDLCEGGSNPCDFNHCGPGSECYLVNGAPACDCVEGFVARGVADPILGAAVTCTPEGRDMLAGAIAGDPCASTSCGEFGVCVAINGNANCGCQAGYVAATQTDGSLRCESMDIAELPGADQFEAGPREDRSDAQACSVASGPRSDRSLFALIAAALAACVTRRRRTV